jgi:23S rRNA pseudouridine955/2504/2580 synthase
MRDPHNVIVGPDADGQRLDRWLKKELPRTPYALLQKMMRTGQIRINGKRAKADARLVKGDTVRIPPAEEKDLGLTFVPKPGDDALVKKMVIYDDGDILAFNKPYGLAVQGGPNITRHLDGLLEHLRAGNGERPKLVHRLDRDTSGVLVCARSLKMANKLGTLFASRALKKVYWALLSPGPAQEMGVLDGALAKGTGGRKEDMVIDPVEGKAAQTVFEVLARTQMDGVEVASCAFWPRTGRTHQIRVHAASLLKCPIVGDERYGVVNDTLDDLGVAQRLHLHAAKLVLPHPVTGKNLSLKAPLPPELVASCKALGLPPHVPNDVFADLVESD